MTTAPWQPNIVSFDRLRKLLWTHRGPPPLSPPPSIFFFNGFVRVAWLTVRVNYFEGFYVFSRSTLTGVCVGEQPLCAVCCPHHINQQQQDICMSQVLIKWRWVKKKTNKNNSSSTFLQNQKALSHFSFSSLSLTEFQTFFTFFFFSRSGDFSQVKVILHQPSVYEEGEECDCISFNLGIVLPTSIRTHSFIHRQN